MKKIYTSVLLIFLFIGSFSQIPAHYYDAAANKTGATLKTALFNIIKDHTVLSYTPGLWNAYYKTDVDKYYENDGSVLDIYSEKPNETDPYNYVFGTDQCGSYSVEGDCYNREHSFPKSWFNDASPMYSDIFHIYPTDGKVNGQRSNWPYGKVNNPTWTSLNGSKLGPCSYPGYTGTVFEPIDEFKGDLARTYFYMATCYEDKITGWNSVILNGTTYPCYSSWHLAMLLEWNTLDPVSQKEIDRNDSIYKIQGNRNPYIDRPQYVNRVFDPDAKIEETNNYKISIYPNPVTNNKITISTNNLSEKQIVITNIDGKIIKTENSNQKDIEIDLSNFHVGIYFVKITFENTIVWKKIIIEK